MIRVKLPIVPPTVTAQQKGVFVRNGRAHFFTKQKVRDAEDFLAGMLATHAPEEPIHEPVFLQVRWCFPYRKSEKKSVTRAGLEIPHTSRPDLDNLEKALLDVLTRLRYWEDDAQVFTKSTAKVWGPSPYLAIAIKTEAELYGTERTSYRRKAKIYIAGPMRGLPDFNYPAFNHAAQTLRGLGWDVVNPAEIGASFGTPEQIDANPALLAAVMDTEIDLLETCDVILLLDGWDKSEGAKNELAAALAAGLEVRLINSPRPLLTPPEIRYTP